MCKVLLVFAGFVLGFVVGGLLWFQMGKLGQSVDEYTAAVDQFSACADADNTGSKCDREEAIATWAGKQAGERQ